MLHISPYRVRLIPKSGASRGGNNIDKACKPISQLIKRLVILDRLNGGGFESAQGLGTSIRQFLPGLIWEREINDTRVFQWIARRQEIRDSLLVAIDQANGHIKEFLGNQDSRIFSDVARVICAPNPELKFLQSQWKSRLDRVPRHPRNYGFVRGLGARDCGVAHAEYWGERKLTFLNMDIQNFFPSVTEKMITKTLEAHKFPAEDIPNVIQSCCVEPNVEIANECVRAFIDFAFQEIQASELHPDIGFSSSLGARQVMERRLLAHLPLYVSLLVQHEIQLLECIRELGRRSRLKRIERLNLGHLTDTVQLIEDLVSSLSKLINGLTAIFLKGGLDGQPFLPQGSPASPVISSLCMKRADIRLTALASKMEAFYTRYADDITFSWKFRVHKRTISSSIYLITQILSQEGFTINPRKTKLMGPGCRQDVVGYLMNSGRPTISWRARHALRAQLHYAARTAITAERANSLLGHVSHVRSAHPRAFEEQVERLLGRFNEGAPAVPRAFHISSAESVEQECPAPRTLDLH
jgi:hypothetical protein